MPSAKNSSATNAAQNLQLLTSPQEVHVRATNVEKRYWLDENEVQALHSISIELMRGEMVAFCGASGSGKTTLLNLIGCLDTTSSGEIWIAGKNVSLLSDKELAAFRAHQLGFVFQTFNLLPVLTAVENVEYPLLKKNISSAERRKLALQALKEVGLEKFASHRPAQLSGGQRQRVAIARAIVHSPGMVIADEPTANLDKKTAVEILDLMSEMNRKKGITFVIATHDPLVMSRVGRIIPISDGHLG